MSTGLWSAQDALQTTPHNREHVWPDQGLALDRHAVRSLCPHILLSHLYRCNSHLLSQRMGLEPRVSILFWFFDSVTQHLATFGLVSIVQSFPSEQL